MTAVEEARITTLFTRSGGSSGSSSSTSTTTNGRNYNEMHMEIEQMYIDYLGRKMPPDVSGELRRRLFAGDERVFVYFSYAITETAKASRPSWQYMRAIIQRLYREDVAITDLVMAMSSALW